MTRAKLPKYRAAALRLLAKGLTTREVAATLRKKHPKETFSEAWVRKVELAGDAPPPSEPAPPSEHPVPDALADGSDLDTYAHTKQAIAEANRSALEARRDGNHAAAARSAHTASEYTKLLARLDKDRKTHDDVVAIPRAEFDRADQAARDVLASLRADLARTGGLVCAECGKKIRIALARGEGKEDPE